jgi:glycosyltransferase involved in cell wall biosynthesis
MIVKNESHIIETTLTTLVKYIKFDYWVIVDTGSSDNTIEIIQNFFKKQSPPVPGKIYETPWKDFGFNRTDAFEKAYNLTDYVFVWDADDSIYGNFSLPDKLTDDSYRITFGNQY